MQIYKIDTADTYRQLSVDPEVFDARDLSTDLPSGDLRQWEPLPAYWLNPLLPRANFTSVGVFLLCCDDAVKSTLDLKLADQIQFLPLEIENERNRYWGMHIRHRIPGLAYHHEGARQYLTGPTEGLTSLMLFRVERGTSATFALHSANGEIPDFYRLYQTHSCTGLKFAPVQLGP